MEKTLNYYNTPTPFPPFGHPFPVKGQGRSLYFKSRLFELTKVTFSLAPSRGKGARRAEKGSFLFFQQLVNLLQIIKGVIDEESKFRDDA